MVLSLIHGWRQLAIRPQILILACFILVAAWSVGQIYLDTYWITGLLFYIPTPAVVAVLAIAMAAISRRQRRVRYFLLLTLISIPPVWYVTAVENQFTTTVANNRNHDLRLVHWNVCRGKLGLADVNEKLRSLSADVYVISEAPEGVAIDGSFHTLRFGSMLVSSRFPLEAIHSGDRFHVVNCISQQGDLKVLIADLPSSIMVHRHPLLSELNEELQVSQSDLLIGDLNAPRRSMALSHLPDGYHHAYDSAGSGWGYTWPSFMPVLAIDQCIHGPAVTPISYQLQTAACSDHRIQILDFNVREPGQKMPQAVASKTTSDAKHRIDRL